MKEVEWIKCEDRLPERVTKFVVLEPQYLVVTKSHGFYRYDILRWADGWNTSINPDGSIDREYEIHDIEAWAEIPKYEAT